MSESSEAPVRRKEANVMNKENQITEIIWNIDRTRAKNAAINAGMHGWVKSGR